MIDEHRAGEILAQMVGIARTLRSAGHHGGQQSLMGTKYGFLQQLARSDSRLSDLAEGLQVSMSVASRAVDALEQHGLVARAADPADARASVISITAQGHERLQERNRRVVGRFADLLDDWSPDDADQALATLRRLNAHLGEVTSAPTGTEHSTTDESEHRP